MKNKARKILTIGGGSGQCALLAGLRDLKDIEITSVASMVDNGGSTGKLRNELGTLPPGDALKCIIALSPYRHIAKKILLKKLNGNNAGRLQGHNAGNMLMATLSKYAGSFPSAIRALSEMLEVRGKVLPATTDKATLVAELADGSRIYGESAIDIPQGREREQIREVFLVPHYSNSIEVYPPVIEAIKNTDYIFIGPGDLFTSIIPGLIVPGMKESLQKTGARVFYILNLMTKFGETHHYRGSDFVQRIEKSIQRRVDGIICNTTRPEAKILKKYLKQNAEFVETESLEDWKGNRMIYAGNLLDAASKIVRHDSQKLASLIHRLVFKDFARMRHR